MYALNIDKETNRILSATYPEYASEDMPKVDELPAGDISDYLYIDGEYIYSPLPKPETPEEPTAEAVTWDTMAAAIKEGVNSV